MVDPFMNAGEPVSGMPYCDEPSGPREDMAAYDELPTMVRKVVARFPANLESPAILEFLNQGGSPIAVINELRQLEAEFLAHAYSERGVQ